MEKDKLVKKVGGFIGQVLLVAGGVIVGMFLYEQIRKPHIAPPAAAPATASTSSTTQGA